MANFESSADEIIAKLDLAPLTDEGGFFKNVYTASVTVQGRPVGTSIYYLVTPQSFSRWHKLDCDEIYHFYAGVPLRVSLLDESGFSQVDLGANELYQFTVPAGTWQASLPLDNSEYSLVGTNCFPGFEARGFEMPTKSLIEEWLAKYPDQRHNILKMAGEQ